MTDTIVRVGPIRSRLVVTGQGLRGPAGLNGAPISCSIPADENLIAGAPVYVTALGGAANADSTALPTAIVRGVVTSNVSTGFIAEVVTSGTFEQPAAAWDLITGGVGGLTPSATYYVDTTAGLLSTAVPPGAAYCARVGEAVSATCLAVDPWVFRL